MSGAQYTSLLVTAGDGPPECNQAVGHVLGRMQEEAALLGLALAIDVTRGRNGPKSAVVVVHGAQHRAFASAWCGTVLWRMQSRLRRHHKRSNWFVGVYEMGQTGTCRPVIRREDVAFSTLRAGGPGGQHQNTTDSAVRARHRPTGLAVVVREARSQHRNKALALERLQGLLEARALAEEDAQKRRRHQLHHALERGNPVRRFSGPRFEEVGASR